jgi:D-alanyl-D-alanine carboxypeptidase
MTVKSSSPKCSSSSRSRALPVLAVIAVLAGAAVVAGVSAPVASATAVQPPHRSVQRAGLVRLAEHALTEGVPGVIVRVNDSARPSVEFARQRPWTEADHHLGVRDEFHMASNTKTMVATVILKLVAAHRLHLDDPVERWLPGLIPGGESITVRMLLNHTSGIFDYAQDPDGLRAITGQDARQWTPRQLIALGTRHDPLFAPGTAWGYSNTNYIALGLVAEAAAHHNLGELIQDLVARPIGLRHTYLATGSRLVHGPHQAIGYEPDAAHLPPVLPPGYEFVGPVRPEGHVEIDRVNDSLAWSAGGMVSTADDWARFLTALSSGELLPSALLHEMRTTVVEEPGNPNRYGLGLERIITPCGTVWGQDANIPGYHSVDVSDRTGHRTASVFTTMALGMAGTRAGAATQQLVDATVCVMFDKPIPAA